MSIDLLKLSGGPVDDASERFSADDPICDYECPGWSCCCEEPDAYDDFARIREHSDKL